MKTKYSTWKTYMSGGVGDSGYYIENNYKRICYGPFKTRSIAEFFNLMAFGSPRDLDFGDKIKEGIIFYQGLNENAKHPREMFASNSKFALWLYDLYGKPLTTKLVLDLAAESGANGYKSFKDWLINGSKIDGMHLAILESS